MMMKNGNEGGSKLSVSESLYNRTKHLDVCHHFICELSASKKLDIKYDSTG